MNEPVEQLRPVFKLPSIESYGQHRSQNYGIHCLLVTVGGLEIFFSYKTPVAFRTIAAGLVCSENEWGSTTGKHLNWIQRDKKLRVSRTEFETRFRLTLDKRGLTL